MVQALLLLALFVGASRGVTWGYEGADGPDYWSKNFPGCGGLQQSPINIVEFDTVYEKFPGLRFSGYDTWPTSAKLTNNGHTAILTLGVAAEVSGGPLGGDTYVYVQLHFHWGEDFDEGSENTINGWKYPLEVHVVHYNKKYGDFNTALNHPDGLLVLGFLFRVSIFKNWYYEALTNELKNVEKADTNVALTTWHTLSAYLGTDRTDYFTFRGSLTTPPCSEIATWLVFQNTIPISWEQLDKFRHIRNHEQALVTHNYRPTQPRNGRVIHRSRWW